MGGRDAARGFEYQYLATLEYTLDALLSDSLTKVVIDAPPHDDPHADQEIVDFSLYSEQGCDLVAQVKGGIPGSTMSAAQAVRQILRLSTHRAGRYLVVTNRRMGPSLAALRDILAAHATGTIDSGEFRRTLLELVQDSPSVRHDVESLPSDKWKILRRADIVVDERGVDQLREVLRERVRTARRALDPTNATWDAAGLLLGFLLSEVMAKAATVDTPALSASDLKQALAVAPDTLMSAMRRRGWSVHVTMAPRGADVARPDLLRAIARALPTPLSDESAPICVLKGMSGIGKTSLAVAWANDRADAYAAIIWIDASETARIEASFATVAEWLRQEGLMAPGPDLRTRVLTALAQSARPWLVVFDNAVDVRLIREWIPSRGRGHVLVTTTDHTALKGSNIAEVVVTEMTLSEACDLLARRLMPAGTRSEEERAKLVRVARIAQCWPLALELAASYLVDCLDGLNGVDDYEQLVMRSLDDDLSVPHGYPRTLVKAIELAWQRMLARANAGSVPDDVACAALRFGAFFSSRVIPLHLLLACVFVPPIEVVGHEERHPIFGYTGVDPTAGEIVRAIRRESLVSDDEPLVGNVAEAAVTPSSFEYAITMNEIVQAIICDITEREGHLVAAVSVAAMHTQSWLGAFCNSDRIDLAAALISHAISIAEHALAHQVDDLGVALLWGNTAKVLGHLNHWAGTVQYLRAELDYFDRSALEVPILRLQVTSGLADALARAADRPHDVVDDVIALLERCLADVSSAATLDEEKTAQHIRLALATVRNLTRGSRIQDPRLTALESALVDYCAMLPITDGPDVVQEVSVLEELLEDERLADARERAEGLLEHPRTTSLYRPLYLRYLVEICVRLPDWSAAADYCQRLMAMANQNMLGAMDVALLVRNVSVMSLPHICRRQAHALKVFRNVLAIADIFEQNGHRLQADDRATVALLRALFAAVDGAFSECGSWLERVDADDLQLSDHKAVLSSIFSVFLYWYRRSADGCLPEQKVLTEDVGGTSTIVVPVVSAGGIIGAVRQVPQPNAVPCFTVAIAHTFCMSGHPIRDGLSVAAELAETFRLLGFEAEVIETVLQAWAVLGSDSADDMCQIPGANADPHFVVWASSFGRIIDPTIVHTPAFFPLIEQGVLDPGPTVFTVDSPETLRHSPITLRASIGLEYRLVRYVDKEVAATAWRSTTTPTAGARNMLLTLLMALPPIRIDEGERMAEIIRHHSALKEALTLPATLAGARATEPRM
ncbi:MAG TPA: NB-ARC domain-containing protein [Actinophytocola sp.]|uniref:NB-ARC domain-containing protein n=1 Tax=Actinophytocola sp. TaxID=1872138 RepID=UPI002DDD4B72|nr:NB-ARC domain-containing protein [Actinophytocola sp.]HEV2779393.1 NB-ARC domain-containing protein [Actinophytocola sp.]